MNCFEARPLFTPFWKRILDDGLRRTLVAHFKDCGNCDRSFRAFALAAAALSSEPLPTVRAAQSDLRRFAQSPSRSNLQGHVRQWIAVLAASLLLAIGSSFYALRTTPAQALEEDLSPADSIQDASFDYSFYAQPR
jgi:hypothetical protein